MVMSGQAGLTRMASGTQAEKFNKKSSPEHSR